MVTSRCSNNMNFMFSSFSYLYEKTYMNEVLHIPFSCVQFNIFNGADSRNYMLYFIGYILPNINEKHIAFFVPYEIIVRG